MLSHPIQYYSPWLAHLHARDDLELKVHYLWDFGVAARHDPQFGQTIRWDIPLLAGYPHEFVPNRSPRPGTHHFRGLDNPDLVERVLAFGPDTILLFGYAHLSHARVLLSPRLAAVPKLLRGDSHDLGRTWSLRARASRLLRRLLFRRFDGFLAVGKANARYLLDSGIAPERLHFAPHCVDNARFRAAAPAAHEQAMHWRADLGIPARARVLLFSGKFEPKKRPQDLLQAFLGLPLADDPGDRNAVLLFSGAGELEGELRQMAGDAAGRRVFFAPFQNQSEMPRVYAAGDVLVLPSLGSEETWGLAVNEAMNLARPVVVSTHVGCAEDLVVPGETGWVFPAGDVDALAATLATVRTTPAARIAAMGKQARDRVALYSFEAATAGLVRALQTIEPGRCPDAR